MISGHGTATWIRTFFCLTIIFMRPRVSETTDAAKTESGQKSPFRVIWNYPDQSCLLRNIDLELSKYGIVANNPRTFVGNEVATLYSSKFGLWPSFQAGSESHSINGGIPQLANLTAHLEKLRKDITSQIQEGSTGYAVLDQEIWRTLYDLNYGVFRIYQQESMKEAGRKYGLHDRKLQRPEAVAAWNKAAREFMERSLLEAREARPDCHWGYYLYPQTWWTKGQTQAINDRMAWLYKASTGIFPSIYLNDADATPEYMKQRVETTLNEAIRVRDVHGQSRVPIIAYTLVQNANFFTKEILDFAIGLPAEMGIDGVIIWGSSTMFKPSPVDKCRNIKNYVHDVLGPYVSQLLERFTNCSTSKCSGHGRCVRKEYAQTTANILHKTALKRQSRVVNHQDTPRAKDSIIKRDNGFQLIKFGSTTDSTIKRENDFQFRVNSSIYLTIKRDKDFQSTVSSSTDSTMKWDNDFQFSDSSSTYSTIKRDNDFRFHVNTSTDLTIKRGNDFEFRVSTSTDSPRKRDNAFQFSVNSSASENLGRLPGESDSGRVYAGVRTRGYRFSTDRSAQGRRHEHTALVHELEVIVRALMRARARRAERVKHAYSRDSSLGEQSNTEQVKKYDNFTRLTQSKHSGTEPVQTLRMKYNYTNVHQTKHSGIKHVHVLRMKYNYTSLPHRNHLGINHMQQVRMKYNYTQVPQRKHSRTESIQEVTHRHLDSSGTTTSNVVKDSSLHPNISYSYTRAHRPETTVQVTQANHVTTITTLAHQQSVQTHVPVAHSAPDADPYENYVCQCYSSWAGPSCGERWEF